MRENNQKFSIIMRTLKYYFFYYYPTMRLTKQQLKQVLIEQHEMLISKPLGIKRDILKDIEKKINLPHIIVITGIRRSGKSTLMRQIIRKFYNDKNCYYITFEDERLLNFPANEFNDIYEALIEIFGEAKTLFIDEIQNIRGFESFVRRFYDNGFKIFITGSNANLLSSEISTKLTGRHLDLFVKPFSFKEFLKAKNTLFKKDMLLRTTSRAQIKRLFESYFLNGGMPEYVIYGDPEILSRVYEDIILKDIAVRRKVSDILQLRELYRYLITNFSRKFSYNSLKQFVKINSANTIKKYVDYLVEVYIAIVINKFDYSVKKQIVNNKKIYLMDNGFAQRISIKTTIDKGWLLENLVLIKLIGKTNVFYYSGKKECDFITIVENKFTSAIQVAYELTDGNRERETQGLVEATVDLNLKGGLILTYDQEEELEVQGKLISVKPVWKWLLEE